MIWIFKDVNLKLLAMEHMLKQHVKWQGRAVLVQICNPARGKVGVVCELVVVNMSTLSKKRLIRNFKKLQQDPPVGINGAPQHKNIMLWDAVIFELDDTPWDEGGGCCY